MLILSHAEPVGWGLYAALTCFIALEMSFMTLFSGESVVSSRGPLKFTHLSVEPQSPTAPLP